jgi:hypothetical protein
VASSSSPDWKWWFYNTSSMRTLNRSTMPLVCGDLGGVSRCLMSSAVQSLSNSCFPLCTRLRKPDRRSVNSFPLSIRMVRTRSEQARSRSGGSDAHWPLSCCCRPEQRPSEWLYQSRQTDTVARIHRLSSADTSHRCGCIRAHKP